jgi:hypothetical protein
LFLLRVWLKRCALTDLGSIGFLDEVGDEFLDLGGYRTNRSKQRGERAVLGLKLSQDHYKMLEWMRFHSCDNHADRAMVVLMFSVASVCFFN